MGGGASREPLAVPHVGLAARNVAQLPGVDQQDLDAAGLQQFGRPARILSRCLYNPRRLVVGAGACDSELSHID